MSPSHVLTVLSDLLSKLPPEEVITAGKLHELVSEAQKNVSYSEYEESMGEDL